MAKEKQPIVIVRRRKGGGGKPHGAWKIAYSDFMTAMMAFFLVMWLMAGLSDSQLENISEYFRTPLRVALVSGDKQSASNSAIPGGGDDHVHSKGERALTEPDPKNYHPQPSMHPNQRLRDYKDRLESMVEEEPTLRSLGSQLKIDMVQDGLRIQITDSKKRPMFRLGSASIQPRMRRVLEKIAPMLEQVPNKITLTGHTDDLQYASGDTAYSNWELSSDRANASRRALVAGNMPPDKILRVKGAADTMRLEGTQPGAPANRRISILVLNEVAQARIEQGGADGSEVLRLGVPEEVRWLWTLVRHHVATENLLEPNWIWQPNDAAPDPQEQFERIIGGAADDMFNLDLKPLDAD